VKPANTEWGALMTIEHLILAFIIAAFLLFMIGIGYADWRDNH
jgi:hypothetical protein